MTDTADEPPKQHPQREGYTGKRPRACKKDYDKLVKQAWAEGWWCERRSDGYVVCKPPDGSTFVVVPCTPSKQGTLDRVRRQFRKRGLDV